jgi:hypothetical protein
MRARWFVLVALVAIAAPVSAQAASPPWVWHTAGSIDSKGDIELACPSSNRCLAVDHSGRVMQSHTPAAGGASWTSSVVVGASAFASLACASASECFAGDSAGRIWTLGGHAAPVANAVDSGQPIAGIDCPTAQLCVAVSDQDVLISKAPQAQSWQAFKNVWYGGDYECVHYNEENCQVPLASVSCSSSTNCQAVDGEGGLLDIDPATASFSDGYGIDPDVFVNGSACVAGGQCLVECAIGEGASDDCDGNLDDGDYSGTAVCDDYYASCNVLSSQGFGWLSCPLSSACFTSDPSGRLLATFSSPEAASRWKTVIAGISSQTVRLQIQSVACASDSSCVGVNQNGELFVGAPPPSVSTLRRLMARWLRDRHTNTYSFSSPAAGRLRVTWAAGHGVVAAGAHTFSASGTARVTVQPTRLGRKLLRERPRLRLTATAVLTGPEPHPISTAERFVR